MREILEEMRDSTGHAQGKIKEHYKNKHNETATDRYFEIKLTMMH